MTGYCQTKNKKLNKDKADTLQITFRDGNAIKKYDFSEMKSKEVLKIIVENVNPFLFDITTKQYQNDHLNEMKNEQAMLLNYSLGSLKFDFPETISLPLSTVQTDDTNFVAIVNKKLSKLSSLQKEINEVYYEKIYPKKKLINTDTTLSDTAKEVLKSDIDKIDNDLSKRIDERNNLRGEIKNLSKQKDNSKVAYISQNLFNMQLRDYNESINKLQRFFNFFQALKLLVYSSGKDIKEMKSEKEELANLYLKNIGLNKKMNSMDLIFEIHTILSNVSIAKASLDNTFNDFILKKKNTEVDKELTLNMTVILKDLNEQMKKININALDEIIGNTVLLYNAINEESFTYHFLINNVKEKADYVSFEFNATSKNAISYIIKPKPIFYSLTVPLKKGIQMNVSSGFFFNIGIFNKEYKYQAVDSKDSLFKIVQTSGKLKEHFSPSIGLLLHVYQRSNSATKLAGSLGFSTNNATDLRYYVGGSVIFGKSQRFVFSTGAVGGQRQILKSSFGESRYDDINDKITVSKEFKDKNLSIPTQAKFRVGWFMSLTLNLWGKNTKEFDFESLQKTGAN